MGRDISVHPVPGLSGLGSSALWNPLSGSAPSPPRPELGWPRAGGPLGQVLGGGEQSVVVREAAPGIPRA